MVEGEKLDIKAAYFGTINGTVRYRIVLAGSGEDGNSYASVSNKGILKAKKAGNIKVSPQGINDGSYYDKKHVWDISSSYI